MEVGVGSWEEKQQKEKGDVQEVEKSNDSRDPMLPAEVRLLVGFQQIFTSVNGSDGDGERSASVYQVCEEGSRRPTSKKRRVFALPPFRSRRVSSSAQPPSKIQEHGASGKSIQRNPSYIKCLET